MATLEERKARAGKIVLIADDMSSMRAILKKILETIGYTRIIECDNGKKALGRVKVSNVDLIISDWDMPVMTGIEFLREVRSSSDPQVASTPFIMVTANASSQFVMECIQAKVSDYIVKPFQPKDLEARIDKVWERLAASSS